MSTWFQRNQLNMLVVGVLAGIFVMSLVESVQANGGYDLMWASGFWQNFSTEVMGAIVTFLLFEMVIAGRREQDARLEAQSEQLERLIRIMQSMEHLPATNAVEELRARNWLKDGSLAGRDFKNAHLKDLYLAQSNFEDCVMCNANLQDASLEGSHLEKADLSGANLQGANLANANLRGANLKESNLVDTTLTGADLRGANLSHAKLGDYSTFESRFNNMRLPDGTRWSREVRTTRFTDPSYPNYRSTQEEINKLRVQMGLPPIKSHNG
jgi:hypothetical protein